MARTPTLGRKCIAEFIGTAFLVFVGGGAITGSGHLLGAMRSSTAVHLTLTISDLGTIALAFGFAIAIMVYTIGHLSGCHINPAVTIAFATTRRMSWSDAGFYILSQFLGSILGALLVALAFGTAAAKVSSYGASDFSVINTGYIVATILEAVGTFFLLFVIMGTAIDGRAPAGWAGLMIGLTVTAGIFAIGPITGGSFNPARSLGPAVATWLFGGSYSILHLLVYFIGPIIGGVLGAVAYEAIAHIRVADRPAAYQRMEAEGGE